MKNIPATITFVTVFVYVLFSGCSNRVQLSWKPVADVSGSVSNICIDVYVENSGSMYGYMVDGSELKDAVHSYVSYLAGYADTVSLNYVNSSIFYAGSDVKEFIAGLTPAGAAQTGGNKADSNIDEMFGQILERTRRGHVAIFITDCILDVRDGDALKFFHNSETNIRNAFLRKKRTDGDFSVEIMRMISAYSGRYFYPAGGSEALVNARRPYYIFIMGDKGILSYLNTKVPYSETSSFDVDDYCAFTSLSELPFTVTNKYGKPFNGNMELNAESDGTYTVCAKVDFSKTLQNDKTLCDAANYSIFGGNVGIKDIKRLKGDKDYTHIVTLSLGNNVKSQGVQISLEQKGLPLWVEAVNDDTGKNIKGNLDKTTGIKYIVQGIADAYKADGVLGNFKFSIKK